MGAEDPAFRLQLLAYSTSDDPDPDSRAPPERSPMSLWTPEGEHPVDRGGPAEPDLPGAGDDPFADLSPEERAQAEEMLAEMAEAQQRLADTPAEDVVANHAVGFYQLAAIHLSQQPPQLDAAKLAIDAMSALLERLEGRLGEHEGDLRAALGQIQLAFVQVQSAMGGDDA